MILRACCLLLCLIAFPANADPKKVGLEIVLAVDSSASISGGAMEFQLRGHAAAFRDPTIIDAAGASPIAVTLVAFSGPRTLKVLVPWTVIGSAEQAEGFAKTIMAAPRDVPADSTALGSAIEDAAKLFDGNGVEADRKVIDLVSNGFSNSGIDPAAARDRAVKRGITVNALAILDEFPWLEEYYEASVVGGPNAFVKTAENRDSFAEALRQKLILEIAALPEVIP